MSIKTQAALEKEVGDTLDKLEKRFAQIGKCGLRYFTGLIKDIFADLTASQKAKDDAIYGELMQIETLIRANDADDRSAQIIKKIHKIKGVVATGACVCFLCMGMAQFSNNFVLHRNRPRELQVRTVRTSRKGEAVYG